MLVFIQFYLSRIDVKLMMANRACVHGYWRTSLVDFHLFDGRCHRKEFHREKTENFLVGCEKEVLKCIVMTVES